MNRIICILMCLGMFLSVNAQGNQGNDKEFINELESKTSKIQTIYKKRYLHAFFYDSPLLYFYTF